MNGIIESVQKKHEKFQELLNKHLDSLVLSKINQPQDIELYLNLNRDQLAKLSDTECGEIAYIIGQYAFFIQKEENQLAAQLNWIKTYLNQLVLPVVGNYKGYSLDERRAQAERDNEAAQSLIQLQKLLQGKLDASKYLSQRIEFLAKVLIGLQNSKRSVRYN